MFGKRQAVLRSRTAGSDLEPGIYRDLTMRGSAPQIREGNGAGLAVGKLI